MKIVGIIIIIIGVIFGNLENIFNMIYVGTTPFGSEAADLQKACITFIILQPLWYGFLFFMYGLAHQDDVAHDEDLIQEDDDDERTLLLIKKKAKYFLVSPLYSLLMYTKLLPAINKLHISFVRVFKIDHEMFLLLSSENCFQVQIFTEFFLQTLPQLIIQVVANNKVGWTPFSYFSLLVTFIMFFKNVSLITIFLSQRAFDGI